MIICGDALEVMAGMGDNSIDLIATDPPYYKVKGEWWDRQWDDAGKFIEWVGRLCEQWHRILKPNGSLYVFASPKMAARVEVEVGRRLNPLNRIRWIKEAGWHNKARPEDLRSFISPWEEIIFAEHYGADNIAKGEAGYGAKCDELRGFVFESLRDWFVDAWAKSGLSRAQVDDECKTSNVSQYWFLERNYQVPTSARYAILQRLAPAAFCREYEELRREYEELRREYEELRRPFNLTADVPYTDVWTFPTVSHYPGKHPCEKPLAMMEHIVRTSSREGATVLDCFAGSGATLKAAKNLGRKHIGIDIEEKWCRAAEKRLAEPIQLELA